MLIIQPSDMSKLSYIVAAITQLSYQLAMVTADITCVLSLLLLEFHTSCSLCEETSMQLVFQASRKKTTSPAAVPVLPLVSLMMEFSSV